MAQRTTVVLVDDVDGSAGDETVEFGVDGARYEIDLTREHAEELRGILAAYVAGARRTSRRGPGNRPTPPRLPGPAARPPRPNATAQEREQNQAVRAWAAEHGHPVAARGRIPAAVSDAYHRNDPSALPSTEPGPSSPPVAPDDAVTASAPPVTAPAASAGEKVGPDGLVGSEREQIRAWAQEQGIEVKTRGRLSKDLIGNYRATTSRV